MYAPFFAAQEPEEPAQLSLVHERLRRGGLPTGTELEFDVTRKRGQDAQGLWHFSRDRFPEWRGERDQWRHSVSRFRASARLLF